MAFGRSRLLRQALSLLLIVVGGLAFWRLTLEGVLLGAILLLQLLVDSPRGALLALVCLSAVALVVSRTSSMGGARAVLHHVLVVVVSVTTGVLLFQTLAGVVLVVAVTGLGLYDWSRLSEAFLEHPVVGSANLLLLGLLWGLVVRLDSRRAMQLAGRVVLLLSCVAAGMFSTDLILGGIVSIGVDGSISAEAGWPLAGGALLVVFCALGTRYVFGLQAPRWAVVLATLTTILIVLIQHALQFLPGG